MSTILVFVIALAGGLGAAVRHLIDTALPLRFRERFPWGIMVINLTGSLALGLIVGAGAAEPYVLVAGTGFLGGYTTFSTASLDTVRLLRARRYLAALANGPGMLLASVGLAITGMILAAGYPG